MSITHGKLRLGPDPRPQPLPLGQQEQVTARTRYRTALETRPVRQFRDHRLLLHPITGLHFNECLGHHLPPLNRHYHCQRDTPCSTLRPFSDPIPMHRSDRHLAARGVTMLPTLDHLWFIKVSISVTACPNWISRYRKWKIASGLLVRHATNHFL